MSVAREDMVDAILAHYPTMRQAAATRRIADPAMDAEDLLHDVLLRYWETGAIDRCPGVPQALLYLWRAVTTRAIDINRRGSARMASLDAGNSALTWRGVPVEREAIARAEVAALLGAHGDDAALRMLLLRHAGYSDEEIRADMGLPEQGVKARIFRWRRDIAAERAHDA